MGFLKRLFSIGRKDKPKFKRYSRPEALEEDIEEEYSRVAEGEEEHEETVGRLLRTSSKRYNVVQEVDYTNMPPMPHPINNIVSQSTPYLTPQYTAGTSTISLHSTLGTSTRYNVTVHRQPTPDRQPSSESIRTPSKGSQRDKPTPKARTRPNDHDSDDNDPLNPNNDSRALRLRSDPSVASLLSLYDEHGRLPEAVFSNSPEKKPTTKPVKVQSQLQQRHHVLNDDSEEEGQPEKVGRAQCKRSGSTLRQLLGVPLANGDGAGSHTDEEGDISWAERFLEETSSNNSTSSSLPLPTPITEHADQSFCSIISDTTIDNPAISSMDVELSQSSGPPSVCGEDGDTSSILRELALSDASSCNGSDGKVDTVETATNSRNTTPYNTPYKSNARNSPYRNSDPSTPQRASQVFDFITKRGKQSKPPADGEEREKDLPPPPPSSFYGSSSSDGRRTPSSRGTTPRARGSITPSKVLTSPVAPLDLSRSTSTPRPLSHASSTSTSTTRPLSHSTSASLFASSPTARSGTGSASSTLSRATSAQLSLSRSTSAALNPRSTTPHGAPTRTSSSRRPMSELVDSFTRSFGSGKSVGEDEVRRNSGGTIDERPISTGAVEPTILEDEQLDTIAPLTIEELTTISQLVDVPERDEQEQDLTSTLPASAFQTPMPSSKTRPVKVLMSGPTKVIVTAPTPGSGHPTSATRIPRGPRSKPSGSRSRESERRRRTSLTESEKRRRTSGSRAQDGCVVDSEVRRRRVSSGEKRRTRRVSGGSGNSRTRMSTPVELVSGTRHNAISSTKDLPLGRESKRKSTSANPLLVNDENDPNSLLNVQSASYYKKERREKERAERKGKERAERKEKERTEGKEMESRKDKSNFKDKEGRSSKDKKEKEGTRRIIKGSTKSLIAFKYDDASSPPSERDIQAMKDMISRPYKQRASRDNLKLASSSGHTRTGSGGSSKGSSTISTGGHLGVKNEIPPTPLRSQDRNTASSSRTVHIPGFGFDPRIHLAPSSPALSTHARSRSSQERSSTKLSKSQSQRDSFHLLTSSSRKGSQSTQDGSHRGSHGYSRASIGPDTFIPPPRISTSSSRPSSDSAEPRTSRESRDGAPSPLGPGYEAGQPLNLGDFLKPRPSQSQQQKKRSGLFHGLKSASTMALRF